MTSTKKTTDLNENADLTPAETIVVGFENHLAKNDYQTALKDIQAQTDPALRTHMADLIMIEVETRLEKADHKGAQKCLDLLLVCDPARREEARMWFADFYMGRLQKCLLGNAIASYGADLANVLEYAPHMKEKAHELIAHYYMLKLKKYMDQHKGPAMEMSALRELLRYGPQRKEEAYHLFAQRAMEEMEAALENYDKEWATDALQTFLKYAPHRKEEAEAVWEQHLVAAKQRKLYDILGVEREATEEQIRAAYRQLAKKLHPDVNVGNSEAASQMQHVNAAYTVLGDPELRARYDQRGDRKNTV